MRTENDLRRLRAGDLAPLGVVATRGGLVGHALRGGDELLAGDVLVSFAPTALIRSGVGFNGIRPDEERVLACDADAPSVIEVEATTGREMVRFKLPPGVDCQTLGAAAYGPDPPFVFWLEPGPETRSRGRRVIVASGDTKTGTVRRLVDRESTWSIAFHSYEQLDADGQHLCAFMASFHTGWTRCDWKLAKDGAPIHDPKRVPRPDPEPRRARAHGRDRARARVDAIAYQLVLSFRLQAETKRDLRLTIVDAQGKPERVTVLEAGECAFDDRLLTQPEEASNPDLPRLEVIDDDHAIFHEGVGSLEPMVIDLRDGRCREALPRAGELHGVGPVLLGRRRAGARPDHERDLDPGVEPRSVGGRAGDRAAVPGARRALMRPG